jgi:Leu/Phe-tRNA-protein transferase
VEVVLDVLLVEDVLDVEVELVLFLQHLVSSMRKVSNSARYLDVLDVDVVEVVANSCSHTEMQRNEHVTRTLIYAQLTFKAVQ